MSSSGSTTFPFDFDILAPSLMTMPWVRRFWNGSSPPERPGARGALLVKRGEGGGGGECVCESGGGWARGAPPLRVIGTLRGRTTASLSGFSGTVPHAGQ